MQSQNNHTVVEITPSFYSSSSILDGKSCRRTWLGQCDIILTVEHDVHEENFSSVLSKYNFAVEITYPEKNKIQIRCSDEFGKEPITSILLKNVKLIEKIFSSLKVVNQDKMLSVIVRSLEIIDKESREFIGSYNAFHLAQETNVIMKNLNKEYSKTWNLLISTDTVQKLMQCTAEASLVLDRFLSACDKIVSSGDAAEVIAYTALSKILCPEKKSQKNTIVTLKNLKRQVSNLDELLKYLHYSDEQIEKIVSLMLGQYKENGSLYYGFFVKILNEINEKNLLSTDIVSRVLSCMQQSTFTVDDAIQLLDHLNKLKLLLNNELLKIILAGNLTNYSCVSRLQGGSGLEDVNNSNSQLRWGFCSEYAVFESAQQFLAGVSLKTRMAYLANLRQCIAVNEKVSFKENFGSFRRREKGDQFSDNGDEYTAASPVIFTDLVDITKKSLFFTKKLILSEDEMVSFDQHSVKKTLFFNFFSPHSEQSMQVSCKTSHQKIVIQEEIDGKCLPKRKIEYYFNVITTEFSVLSENEINSLYDVLERRYMMPLRNQVLSTDDMLNLIGGLAYYLCVLYPYDRGSAGIILWQLNGLLKAKFGVTVGQINLGPNLNVPFDIYAHLTTDVNGYIAEFKKAILLKLSRDNVPDSDVMTSTIKKLSA